MKGGGARGCTDVSPVGAKDPPRSPGHHNRLPGRPGRGRGAGAFASAGDGEGGLLLCSWDHDIVTPGPFPSSPLRGSATPATEGGTPRAGQSSPTRSTAAADNQLKPRSTLRGIPPPPHIPSVFSGC